MRKSLWSPVEDEKLRRYVVMHGCGNWSDVAKHTGLQRCGKSCRLRWINYLRPDLKRGPFSADEVRNIVNLHNNLGNSWSKIATYLPGRTDNDVKNFWHSYTRSRRLQQQSENDNSEQPTATIINKVALPNYKEININIASGLQRIKCNNIANITTPASKQIKFSNPRDDCEYDQLQLLMQEACKTNYSINPKHIMQFGHESLIMLPSAHECNEFQSESAQFVYPPPSEAYDIAYSEMTQMAGSLINPLISLNPPLMSLKQQILTNPGFSSSMSLDDHDGDKPPEGLQSVLWSFLNRQLAPDSSNDVVNQQLTKPLAEPDHVLINDHNIEAFPYGNILQYSQAQLAGCFS